MSGRSFIVWPEPYASMHTMHMMKIPSKTSSARKESALPMISGKSVSNDGPRGFGKSFVVVKTTTPVTVAWTTTLVPPAIALTFTPSADMAKMFDSYVIEKIRVVYDNIIGPGNTSNAYRYVTAYDPSADTSSLLVSPTALANYENSRIFSLDAVMHPSFEYDIKNPCRLIAVSGSNFLTRDPTRTEETWNAGLMAVIAMNPATTSGNVTTYIHWTVRYLNPRALL